MVIQQHGTKRGRSIIQEQDMKQEETISAMVQAKIGIGNMRTLKRVVEQILILEKSLQPLIIHE